MRGSQLRSPARRVPLDAAGNPSPPGKTARRAFHARNRLQICALLTEVDSLDFATVQAALGVSDYLVSKHLTILIEAGYMNTQKERVHGRAAPWLTLTDTGAPPCRSTWLNAAESPVSETDHTIWPRQP